MVPFNGFPFPKNPTPGPAVRPVRHRLGAQRRQEQRHGAAPGVVHGGDRLGARVWRGHRVDVTENETSLGLKMVERDSQRWHVQRDDRFDEIFGYDFWKDQIMMIYDDGHV